MCKVKAKESGCLVCESQVRGGDCFTGLRPHTYAPETGAINWTPDSVASFSLALHSSEL